MRKKTSSTKALVEHLCSACNPFQLAQSVCFGKLNDPPFLHHCFNRVLTQDVNTLFQICLWVKETEQIHDSMSASGT